MARPFISVVMPSFRQAAFLEEAIGSVLDQDYPHRELIVMDGGSDDGSVAVIERHQARLAYWTSAPDGGQSDALDQGFRRARGELFCWVNSDDVLLPGALSAVAEAWSRSGSPEWLAGNCCWLDPGGRVLRCARGMGWSGLLARYGLPGVSAPSSFFSPRLYQQAQGLDRELHYVMDTDLWLRFARQGARFVRVPRYLWGLRLHPGAKMSGHNFAESPLARPDHPAWERRRSEHQRLCERHGLGPREERLGNAASRVLRALSGASARAWYDTARLRGRHWKDCDFTR